MEEDGRPARAAGSDEVSAPRPGAIFAGRYVLGAILGSGGMGRVYVARDEKLEREVALKVLLSDAPGPEVLGRFRREALATSSLQHPNVLAVFDAGEEHGRPFLVTELLRGTTLKDRLAAGPLPPEETVGIARQLLAGLAAAHEKGFTHRDLKPSNIFITHDGWVKILDFGLVKLAETLFPEGEADFTASGRMLGTVGYMAPEQVRGKPVDQRADLFNLGLVLYEMLCGKRAFRGASSAETGYAILFKEPEPLPSSAPRELRQLIGQCLQKDRDKRPTAAREALALLDGGPARPWRGGSGKLRPSALLRGGVLAAVAVAAALAAVSVYRARVRNRLPTITATAPPSGTVAILPFGARDAPQYAYLSEGIVDLLARDLQGSELRAVDSASVLRALGGDPTADVDKVRGASAQLGAKYFVLGRIEERRGELVLEAVLHTGDAGEPVSQTVVQGFPKDLLRLVRKLSDQLQMRPLSPPEFDARLADLARRTSSSPRALQAWLEGERLLRRGNYDEEVVSAFQRAVAADPQFALAHYRLGLVAYQVEPGLSEDALQRALRYSDRLSPAERSLVEAQLAVLRGRFREAERLLLGGTRRSPDDAQSWMQLGELYFHQNPLRARSPQEAVSAFEHVVTLDPLHVEAVSHLADLAQMRGERALVARLSDRLLAISDDPTKVMSYRLARAWSRGDAAERDQVLAGLRGARTQLLKTAFVRSEWQMDDFAGAQSVAALLTDSESRPLRSLLLSAVMLLRGRPAAARAEAARGADLGADSDAAVFGPWLDTLDFVPASPAELAAARAAAQRIDASRHGALGPAKLHLIGALAARAGDFTAAEAAARQLESAEIEGSTVGADLALAVRARILAARSDLGGALATLERQQLEVPSRYAPSVPRLSEPWLRASLLEALGRPREALAAYDAVSFYNMIDPVFVPMAHLRKARALESLGEQEAAADHYQRFLELWRDCEPAEQPEVERARARVLTLRGSPFGRPPR